MAKRAFIVQDAENACGRVIKVGLPMKKKVQMDTVLRLMECKELVEVRDIF